MKRKETHIVVVLGASPEGDEVTQRPGEVVAAVRVDGLGEAKADPQVHGDDVHVAAAQVAVEERCADRAEAEDEDPAEREASARRPEALLGLKSVSPWLRDPSEAAGWTYSIG